MSEMEALSCEYHQGAIYPLTKRRKEEEVHVDIVGPVSGCFEGKFYHKTVGQATLELKIDVDQIKEHSPVLNVVSGSIVKTKGEFLSIGREKALYFSSIQQSLRFNKVENDREVTCDVVTTRTDGDRYQGTLHIQLRQAQKTSDWQGSCKIEIGDECVTFECVRKSAHFRRVAVDIDYVNQVVWPTITLADFFDVPHRIKDRKLDPYTVFEDAGVKLIYDPRESDKISDPTPHTPWSKNDMYELMLENLDRHEGDLDTIWCMMANKPPDHHYMGYSFDKNGHHGFGLFMDHKSFTGLCDSNHENHIFAKRKFLHYFIHECGHSLGLQHCFELGRPHELTWMNYAWKYDSLNGPGKFYNRFHYSFSVKELEVIRHSPCKAFVLAKAASVSVSSYGIAKSVPSDYQLEEMEEHDEKTEFNLSLRIKLRQEPFRVKELVEIEVRIKNGGQTPVVVEKDLSIDQGNLHMYVTYPDGKIKDTRAFARPITGTAYNKPMLLYPKESGIDRHTQLITIGEGKYGADFDVSGKYHLQAAYDCGETSVVSNKVELQVVEATTKIEDVENRAFILGGMSQSHCRPVEKTWRKMVALRIEEKKLHTSKIVSIVDEVVRRTVRVSARTQSQGKLLKSESPVITVQEFLKETDDLLDHYHSKGQREDNMFYQQLVFARVKAHLRISEDKAQFELSQMVADLICRDVKYPAIKNIMQEFEELKAADKDKEKNAAYYQQRVEAVLDWCPGKMLEKKEDLSGIGLGVLVSEFDNEHVYATSKIVALLFNKLDETNDLDDVFDYADNLQRSYLVNHHVLHWAVEIFIIHCPIAKQSGILYPLPKDKDHSFESSAALIGTERTGFPRETWMDYWRSDADLNYHHRHWHSVYVVGREIGFNARPNWFGRWRQRRPELERQGELFAYMHQQMLARYDAERKSWGLDGVQEWRLDDRDTQGYNAGFEFHNHESNFDVFPRPRIAWPVQTQRRFREWEENYRQAVDDGVLPEVFVAGRRNPIRLRMDFNLSGHVLEAASSTWRNTMGSIHNSGHGVFGSQLVPAGSSYMASTVRAMRDPIFYRWHKRIDNLWQMWNRTQVTELAEDSPSIVIRSNDIYMRKTSNPMSGFASFQSDSFTSDELTTFLGPPIKRFERDNKISHDPFFYHIRFRRSAPGDLNLTFRIFICPRRDIENRQMWIEMDKFVYKLPASQDNAVIIRPDRHSSVIKRIPSEMQGNVEADLNVVDGFCECGWPYNMLLPRGTSNGEDWRVCVFVSDNNRDNIEVRSSCGSLSFCGASRQQYPDRRPMGYPFTTDVAINQRTTSIPNAIEALSNAAMASFVIRNNVVASSSRSVVDVWSPWVQLNLNDDLQSADVISYTSSRIVGRMRVLIDDSALTLNRSRRISVRFQGRGTGNGQYIVSNATVALRRETSLNISRQSEVSVVTVGGQTKFDVPETGLVTDELTISRNARDLFVTFTLESPGCYLSGGRGRNASTWVIRNPSGDRATAHDWDNLSGVQRSSSIYCVSAVMAPIPS